MVLAALVIGLLTAYYFGVRPGIWAAAVAAALMVAALVVPGYAFVLYTVVGAGVVGVVGLGPAYQRPGARQRADQVIRWSIRRVRQLMRGGGR
jgi:ABC-type dipeptide/oligopeptide/nickel transport system permease component